MVVVVTEELFKAIAFLIQFDFWPKMGLDTFTFLPQLLIALKQLLFRLNCHEALICVSYLWTARNAKNAAF